MPNSHLAFRTSYAPAILQCSYCFGDLDNTITIEPGIIVLSTVYFLSKQVRKPDQNHHRIVVPNTIDDICAVASHHNSGFIPTSAKVEDSTVETWGSKLKPNLTSISVGLPNREVRHLQSIASLVRREGVYSSARIQTNSVS